MSSQPVRTVDADGTVAWRLDGELHREDGPALEYADGSRQWCLNGMLHRIGGPAYQAADGSLSWWVHGVRHREDGPAYEGSTGSRCWYVNGMLHRTDGPAIDDSTGDRQWWVDGVRHCVHGPAIVYASSLPDEWWFYGLRIDFTLARIEAFLALPAPAREFVAVHVGATKPGGPWSTWEALFASASEATARTVTLPPASPTPPPSVPSHVRGGA